jgi:hypothetical protein
MTSGSEVAPDLSPYRTSEKHPKNHMYDKGVNQDLKAIPQRSYGFLRQ